MPGFDKPSGYFSYFDPLTGTRQDGETRQCVHCGATWIYDPKASLNRKLGLTSAKPKIRGTCMKCHGLVCALPECLKRGCVPMLKQIEDIETEAALRTSQAEQQGVLGAASQIHRGGIAGILSQGG